MKNILLVVAIIAAVSWARGPGIEMTIRPSVIDQMKTAFLPYFEQQLLSYQIPDQNVYGYNLQTIRINAINADPQQVTTTVSSSGIQFNVNSFGFTSSMVAQRPNSFVEPLVLTGSDCSLSFLVLPVINSQNNIQFTVSNTVVNMQNLQATGDNQNVISTINSLISNQDFLNSMDQTVAQSLQSKIQSKLDNVAAQYPNTMNIPYLPLSISLAALLAPQINPNYISQSLDGTLFWTQGGYTSPPIADAAQIPVIDQDAPQDVQIFISDYVINSGLYYLYENDYLDTTVTDSQIPAASPLRLTTTAMNVIFPDLVSKYGADKPLELHCLNLGNKAPTVKSANGLMTGSITGICDVYVETADTYQRAVSVFAIMDATIAVTVQNMNLVYTVQSVRFHQVEATGAGVGTLTNSQVENNMNDELQEWLPFSRSIPIPSLPSATLVNPIVYIHDGYTEVLADAQFTTFTGFSPQQVQMAKDTLGSLGYP